MLGESWNEMINFFIFSMHEIYSRIDDIFASKDLVSTVIDADVGIMKVTNHALFNTDIKFKCDYKKAKDGS